MGFFPVNRSDTGNWLDRKDSPGDGNKKRDPGEMSAGGGDSHGKATKLVKFFSIPCHFLSGGFSVRGGEKTRFFAAVHSRVPDGVPPDRRPAWSAGRIQSKRR